MGHRVDPELVVSCVCGKARIALIGAPILSADCYCKSCQEAGRRFEQLPGAPAVLEPNGGTAYVLHRKDRVRCSQGAELLEEHRLTPDSATRRVLAVCCNSPLFLDVTQGHWLTLYRTRIAADAPPLAMRVMVRERPPGPELPRDVPNYAGSSGKFMWKLLGAWIAMGFRIPKIDWGKPAA